MEDAMEVEQQPQENLEQEQQEQPQKQEKKKRPPESKELIKGIYTCGLIIPTTRVYNVMRRKMHPEHGSDSRLRVYITLLLEILIKQFAHATKLHFQEMESKSISVTPACAYTILRKNRVFNKLPINVPAIPSVSHKKSQIKHKKSKSEAEVEVEAK